MTFNELVRLIHPDLNPDIKDAGDKMIQAVTYKDNEYKLEQLAIKWGLIDKEPFEIQFTLEAGKDLYINDKKFVIVDIINNTTDIDVVVIDNNKIVKYKRNDIRDQDEEFYVKDYSNESDYISADMSYQCIRK